MSGLSAIEIISGFFWVFETVITSFSDLVALDSLGETWVWSNPMLESFAGFENITTAKVLWIAGNDTLSSLAELNNLTDVFRVLDISSNRNLNSLAGLENLENIGQNNFIDKLQISKTHFQNLQGLNGLMNVYGSVRITNNDLLSSFSGLDQLQNVAKTFYDSGNQHLTDLNGLDGIVQLNHLHIHIN